MVSKKMMNHSEISVRYRSSDKWLADHQINGQRVLPGAIQIEMMLAILSGGHFEAPLCLHDVQFIRSMEMGKNEEGTLHVQTSVVEEGVRFVLSAEIDTQPTPTTIATATAVSLHDTRPPEVPTLATRQQLTPASVYARFAQQGINYGSFFQSMHTINIGEGCAHVSVVPAEAQKSSHWTIHPSIMDAALQVMSLALQAPTTVEQLTTCIPIAIKTLIVWQPIREPVQAVAWRTSEKGAFITGDFLLIDEAGTVLASATGVRMKRTETKRPKAPSPTTRSTAIAHQIEWHAAPAAPSRERRMLPDGTWLLFSAETPHDHFLAATLQNEGKRVLTVTQATNYHFTDTSCTLNPAHEDDFTTLLAQLDQPVQGIIYRWGSMALDQPQTPEALEQQITSQLSALFYCIKAIARQRQIEFYLLTTDAQWLPGRTMVHPIKTAMLGLGRVLSIEHGRFRVRLIDFPTHGVEEAQLLEALCMAEDDLEVAYQDGQRFVRTVQPIAEEPTPQKEVRAQGNYLIIGGQGGIGLEVARHLAAHDAGSLILVNRTMPNAARAAAIEALHQQGVNVWAAQGDVTSLASMQQVWEEAARRFGQIHGVFHCAGILHDGLLRNKTSDNFHAVLKPKVQGSWVLQQLCARHNPDFVMLFSSVSGVFGNLGQGDYAAANTFQDGLALYQSQVRQQAWISLDWGLWGEVGMGLDVAEQLKRRGIQPLTTHEALAELAPAIAAGGGQRIIAHRETASPAKTEPRTAAPVQTAVTDTPPASPSSSEHLRRQTMQNALQTYLAHKLDVALSRVEDDIPFSEFGIDSILAVSMTEELSSKWQRDFPATLFLEYATLEELTKVLVEQYNLPDELPGAAAAVPTTAASVPDDIPSTQPAPHTFEFGENAVAIVAMSGRFPDAADLDTYWQLIRHGDVALREVPAERWDVAQWYEAQRPDMQGTYARWGGFLDNIDQFDPSFFRISPREARELDPQQRLILEQVWQVLEDGGMVGQTDIGVFVAATYTHYRDTQGLETITPYSALGGMNALLANRVSYTFNLTGPSMVVDTLCSSSLVAINQAMKSIRAGECQSAVVVGVQVGLTAWYYRSLSQLGALSTTSACSPFDQSADGFVPGEGVAALLLKPLPAAERDGDAILGVIRACAVNHGGRATALTVPRKQAQADVIRTALAEAGITASEIGYLEAHGTGTALGDPIEIAALMEAFADAPSQRCALGSVKANIGHLEPAAGLASIIKVLLAFRAREIPPLAQFAIPNERIAFEETPFYIPSTAQPWETTQPQHAAVSSFGMGGTNAHLILSPYTAEPLPHRAETEAHIITFSARSHTALIAQIRAFCSRLETRDDALIDMAFSQNVGRGHFKAQRTAVMGNNRAELIAACKQAAAQGAGVYWANHTIVLKPARHEQPDVSAFVTLSPEEVQKLTGWEMPVPPQMRRAITLGQLYVQGIHVDWKKLYTKQPVRRVSLPTYPFDYRLVRPAQAEQPAAKTEPIPADRHHPLWADHYIDGQPLFPAAGLMAAVLHDQPIPVRLDELTLLQPLPWSANLPLIQHRQGGEVTIGREGTLFARGRMSAITPPATAPGQPIQLAQRMDSTAVYDWYAHMGSAYGASLRVIRSCAFSAEKVLTHLHSDAHHATAALLDGILQSAAVLTMQAATPSSFRPFAIYGLELWEPLPDEVYCLFERTTHTPQTLEGRTTLFDSTWRQIGHIEQLIYRNAAAPELSSGDPVRTQLQAAQSTKLLLQPVRETIVRHLEMALDDLAPNVRLADIGLDSIVASAISADFQEQFGIRITPVDILDEVTPLSLAERLLGYGAKVTAAAQPAIEVSTTRTDSHESVEAHTDDMPATAVAIIGAAGRFPDADTLEAFWENLAAGHDSVTDIPPGRWNVDEYFNPHQGARGTTYSRWGAFLEKPDQFDAAFFDLYPRQASLMDPQQRLLLETAWHAIEDAGLAGGQLSADVTAVYIAASYQHYREYNIKPEQLDAYSGPGNQNAFLANRLSYAFDLKGPCMTIDTLCSSSLVALHMAIKSLLLHECAHALVGAVQVGISPIHYQSLSRLRALSPTGRCRTFDAAADGFVPGEGVGVVILKRLADAVAHGDPILAVIRGSAVNHNGRAQSLTVPNSDGQADVIRMALKQAEVPAATLSYVEAHGTGTALGDPVEIEGLAKAYHTDRQQYCAIGSVKSNIGHLEPAAGMAGLLKIVLAFRHGQIPPSLHLTAANPTISFEETPFYVNDRAVAWERDEHPRRAALSAFGLGGVNAHVILEEPPLQPQQAPSEGAAILRVSAKSKRALGDLVEAHVTALRQLDDGLLGHYCYTANTGRGVFAYQLAASGSSAAGIAQNLLTAYANWQPVSATTAVETRFTFGDANDHYRHIANSLSDYAPFYNIYQQYAINHDDSRVITFAVQYALARLLMHWGIVPDSAYGRGVGEYAAACLAGVVEPEIALAALTNPAHRLTLNAPLIPLKTTGNYVAVAQALPPATTEWSLAAAASDTPKTLAACDPTVAPKQALYTALAQYVTLGGEVDWHAVETSPRRRSRRRLNNVPLYPFVRLAYWHEVPSHTTVRPITSTPTASQPSVVELPMWEVVWEPAEHLDKLLTLPRGNVLIFADAGGVGVMAARELERIGMRPLLVYKGKQWSQRTPTEVEMARQDSEQLERFLHSQTLPLAVVMNLWPLDEATDDDTFNMLEHDLPLWQLLGHHLQKTTTNKPPCLLLATRQAQAVTAVEAKTLNPYRHTLTCFVQLLAAELPHVRGFTIDLDGQDAQTAALTLIGEMVHDAPATEISWRGKQRYTRTIRRAQGGAPFTPQADDVFMVTGGLGGVGLQQAQALVESGVRHLALTGRSELDAKKAAQLQQLNASECEVIYLRGDVTVMADVQRLLAETAAAFGHITGIIHTAGGSAQFGSILRKSWSQVQATLAPKLQGSELLLQAARAYSTLRVVVLTSSIASLGTAAGFGLAEYAMANRYLNGRALHRDPHLQIRSQIWPEWHDTGLARGLTDTSHLLPAVSAEEGRALFVQSLGSKISMPLLLQAETDETLVRAILNGTYAAPTAVETEDVQVNKPAQSAEIDTLMSEVADVIRAVLHIESDVDWTRSFTDLGMDSLAIADVIARLERQFGQTLNPTLLLRQPNLQALATKLHTLGMDMAHPPPQTTLETTFAAMLEALRTDDMSLDDAASHLLAQL